MARLRYNNAAGTLGSPALTATATTITFASAPVFGTLASPNYIPLALDPPQGATPSPTFEIVYLTAYTAGATTGTIVRGQEGTTGQAHNVGAVWAQAVTLLDIQGAPVGSIIPYAGVGDPFETNWIIADGRLINKTTYADFFARTGHAYNGGVDPGGGSVKIPDKRGRHSVGALNMGTGAATADNNHVQVSVGQSSNGALAPTGEVIHTLATSEGPVHNHWTNTAQIDLNHAHVTPVYVSVTASSTSSDSGHSHAMPYPFWVNQEYLEGSFTGGPGTAWRIYALNGPGTSSASAAISTTTTPSTSVQVGDAGDFWCRSITGSYGGSQWLHNHSIPWDLGTTPAGGLSAGTTQPHNNLPPYQCDSYIVRIA